MELIDRFMAKVDKNGENGCWLWTGAKSPHGDGACNVGNSRTESAHKVSYKLFVGEIPPSTKVRHKCKNPSCVNPDHLFLGTPLSRFMNRIDKYKDDECWYWSNKGESKNRYGVICIGHKSVPAHRFSYENFVGEIPPGMEVCHSCDNPSCVNPGHLFVGTHKDNMDDRDSKNRFVRLYGENHGEAKLNWEQVWQIRNKYVRGEVTQKELGVEYGVSRECIKFVVSGEHWKESDRP